MSENNCKSLYVTEGFANGYYCLEKENIIYYKLSDHYNPNFESGLIWNDPEIGINWPNGKKILSKKDTERTFNKSLSEWKDDANLLLKSGQGEVIQADDRTVTMIIFISNSILKVSPQYKENNLNRPWKIAVAVEQNKELTAKTKLLGEEGMRKLVAKWHKEMKPEYTVMTEFDLKGETLQINF